MKTNNEGDMMTQEEYTVAIEAKRNDLSSQNFDKLMSLFKSNPGTNDRNSLLLNEISDLRADYLILSEQVATFGEILAQAIGKSI